MTSPLVSCLMVTKPSALRFPRFVHSVERFICQTHERKELVVVLDQGEDHESQRVIDHLRTTVPGLARWSKPGLATLGALRNRSMDEARGDVLCQWDDDDLSHPTRISYQLAAMGESTAGATFLTEVLHWFESSRELYWTNYRRTPHGCHPATVMLRSGLKARYPDSGPESGKGEDTAFCRAICAETQVRMIDDAAHLYLYVSHGGNTWDMHHHRMLASSLGISGGLMRRREPRIRASLDACVAELGIEPIHAMGSGGPGFIWMPRTPVLTTRDS